ncbi:ECF RNA polymerase sigma factor SigW [Anaerotignum neopropionicum]|uniref:ECF RNA polymerase sigma factor SigW n=1 Tax=Anaerotignum neopropionicum TaxID=36847 RepID=A0A136WGK0_9FIRM|nr:sigma-70 family RNA polymerase sigma factor [Anaerotignum neopropionicum]KXL53479.1 ECF RNA polymerase sigma factor SigW [Anaerotignum neopropionicum]
MAGEVSAEQGSNHLISQAKQGDLAAFEALILQHEKIVYNVALRMMNHTEDAKDISQEVFLKAYRNIANFDERSAFSTWIYRITVNTCIDEMRKRKGKQTLFLDNEFEDEEGTWKQEVADSGETPEESLMRKEEKNEILLALKTISEDYKTVFILRDIRGLSYDEIAEITGLALGTVKSRISRARNHLKKEIFRIWERNGVEPRHNARKEGEFHEL